MSALKISFFAIVATLAVLQCAEAQTAQTGLPLTKIGEGFYYFEKNARNWFNAELYCRSYGLGLVSFETQAELNLVGAEIVKQGLVSNGWVWTSGSDLGTEGQWLWSQTGKSINFSAWGAGEPNSNDSDENCLSAHNINGALWWNDNNCKSTGQFVCELPTTCWGY